ncbi:MAG: ABC transporter ATP-binding protein [Cyclobacteriaceae bacterium]
MKLSLKNFLAVDPYERLASSGEVEINHPSCTVIYGPSSSGKSIMLNYINNSLSKDLIYSGTMVDSFKSKFYQTLNNSEKTFPETQYQLYSFDEPERYHHVEEFSSFVKKMKLLDSSVILVTHDIQFIEECADQIVVLKYGDHVGTFSKSSFFESEDPFIKKISTLGC